MDRQLLAQYTPEPVPPPPGPLFESHEVLAFEQFLDDLAIDNSFMFHPKVPASLTWDGFQTTRNKGFEDIKREVQHTGLQFGSDSHFSPDGYIATHKYVPVGFGHVHPHSTAQRTGRSSASSRVHSRRQSMQDGVQISPRAALRSLQTRPTTEAQALTLGLPVYIPHAPPPVSPYNGSTSSEVQKQFHSPALSFEQQYPSPVVPRYEEPVRDDRSTPPKRAKTEDPVGKQPLTAAQKRQNHISSEQKRRNLIKEGFTDLCDCVPKVRNKNESKSVILHEAIDYIRSNQAELKDLNDRLEQLRARA